MMNVNVGDWVMGRPVPGTENTFHKGILAMGCEHTHDEKVGASSGIKVVGNAHDPHFELEPFAARIGEYERGERVMAVFRWAMFCDGRNPEDYERYQACVNMGLHLMAALRLPYDWTAVRSHGRNQVRAWLRRFMPWLGDVLKQVEYMVFCTEGCVELDEGASRELREVSLNVRQWMGYQELVAPVHAERLVRDGHLVLVEDFGLRELLGC